jgi:hypothetical protein
MPLKRKPLGAFAKDHVKPSKAEIQAFLEALRPKGYGDTFDVEPWPFYRERVHGFLPGFPDVVLKEWLWRHYTSAISAYQWLLLPHLAFRQEVWPTDRILRDVGTWEGSDIIDHWCRMLLKKKDLQEDWLGSQMIKNGTWPEAPLIIPNPNGLARPDGLRLGQPFHLMEGSHRVGYLKALCTTPGWTSKESHTVMLVTVPQAAVLNFWPLNTKGA